MAGSVQRLTVGVTAVVALTAAGCGAGGGGTRRAADPPPASVDASPTPAAEQALAAAPPQPTPSTAAPRTTAAKRPPVQPSKRPDKQADAPPAPQPKPSVPPSCKPTYSGTAADRAAVAAALDTAAAHVFWYTSAPSITVPRNLMRAFAWQESGWQSNILACDGGIGTMQIMPNTAIQVNNRFGTSYDVHTLSGNTMLGAGYLEWLIKYLGDLYFQSVYDLSNQALLDSVVSAYNVGPGAVDPTKGAAGIPNPQYVRNVEALMTNCACQSY
jgi:soluble lytic murein transglycosylase-like protein